MKTVITLLFAVFGLNAFAGMDDFNSIIEENQKAQQQLQNSLQKEAGIELRGPKPGSIAHKELLIPSEVEQIVVTTSPDLLTRRGKTLELDEKPGMNRISQEMSEANN